MKIVHIYANTTIRGRATRGVCGYVLALEKDGEILYPQKCIFKTENRTAQGAVLYTISQAVARIHEQVILHIWIDEQLIASAIVRHWIDKWKIEDFAGRKNAEEWRDFITLCEGVGIDIDGIHFHVREPHPFRELLRWECAKNNK